jgi:hypothetical protein
MFHAGRNARSSRDVGGLAPSILAKMIRCTGREKRTTPNSIAMLAKKKYETSDVNFSGNQINPIAMNHTGSSATTGAMAANADVSRRRRDCSTNSVKQKLACASVREF